MPEVTESLLTKQEYKEFNQWINNGGLSAIRHWANTYDSYVQSEDTAPMTKRKAELIEDSKTVYLKHAEQWIQDHKDDDLVIGTNTLNAHLFSMLGPKEQKMSFEDSTDARRALESHSSYVRITPSVELGLKNQYKVGGKNKETCYATQSAYHKLIKLNNKQDIKDFIRNACQTSM